MCVVFMCIYVAERMDARARYNANIKFRNLLRLWTFIDNKLVPLML